MKKHFIAVAGISIGILLTGCARSRTSTFPPEQSAIYVSREGALYTSLVRDYDPSDTGYNTEELLAMAQSEVTEYNSGQGADSGQVPVAVADCRVEEGTASIVYAYAGADHLLRFTELTQDEDNHPETLEVSTNTLYFAAGAAPVVWTDARKNAAADQNTVLKKKDLPLVAVTGPVTVQTEGQILYYSGQVDLKDEFTARIAEGTAYIVFRP